MQTSKTKQAKGKSQDIIQHTHEIIPLPPTSTTRTLNIINRHQISFSPSTRKLKAGHKT